VEPTPYIDRARRSAAAVELERGVLAGFTGVTTEDVQMCLDGDRFDFAMQAVASGAHLNSPQRTRPTRNDSGASRQR
jgi:2-phosphosulfolactate phosphatase